jgi:hypothetical protein
MARSIGVTGKNPVAVSSGLTHNPYQFGYGQPGRVRESALLQIAALLRLIERLKFFLDDCK